MIVSKVTSRSIIDFINEAGFFVKINVSACFYLHFNNSHSNFYRFHIICLYRLHQHLHFRDIRVDTGQIC